MHAPWANIAFQATAPALMFGWSASASCNHDRVATVQANKHTVHASGWPNSKRNEQNSMLARLQLAAFPWQRIAMAQECG